MYKFVQEWYKLWTFFINCIAFMQIFYDLGPRISVPEFRLGIETFIIHS
jgi:hypothetical protein